MPNSSDQIQYLPPQINEVEISLFGPGVGECLVVHIGNNEWIIIDSCIDPRTKTPVPLAYLEKIGVNPSEDVKLITISHWHSDHIRGISKIVEQCRNATVCFSGALLTEEFLTLVDIFSGLERPVLIDRDNCATGEMGAVIKTIKSRCEKKLVPPMPYILASADQRIYRADRNGIASELWSLSPSSESYVRSLKEIANLIPSNDERLFRKVIPKPGQNHNSVVLSLKHSNDFNVLFGADLEETVNPLTGWSVIVNSVNRPSGKASIFKIPHHGSQTAHSDEVWERMIHNDSVSILTSKIGGRGSIPKQSDIERIKKYSPNLYGTTIPVYKKQKRNQTVEKMMKSVVKNRVALDGDIGHIQIRIIDAKPRMYLKSPATKL